MRSFGVGPALIIRQYLKAAEKADLPVYSIWTSKDMDRVVVSKPVCYNRDNFPVNNGDFREQQDVITSNLENRVRALSSQF